MQLAVFTLYAIEISFSNFSYKKTAEFYVYYWIYCVLFCAEHT